MASTVTAEAGMRAFLTTHGVPVEDAHVYADLIASRYGGHGFFPVATQGGCSYTLINADPGAAAAAARVVLQFRMIRYAVITATAQDAARIFPSVAPQLLRSELVALSGDDDVVVQVVAMSFVRGTKFSDIMLHHHRPKAALLSALEVAKLETLLDDMAAFFATAWAHAHATLDGHARARRQSTGLIGSSICQRLAMLEAGLPSAALRGMARAARRAWEAGALQSLPVVLNHGDLLPCNVLVDAATWRVTGVVDWAEAEYLPFGMTLYGIEHLLGCYMYVGEGEEGGEESEGHRRTFVYHREADMLREMFWNRLLDRLPGLCRSEMWRAMLLSRVIGILLWHGIAWDGGKRDRVVDYQRDYEELSCLEQMLGVSTQKPRHPGL